MFNARLLGNGRYYGNRIMADMSRRRWHPTTQVSAKSVHWWASYSISKFQHFPIWRPSAILNFKNFHIWLRDYHWVPNLLLYTKFYQILDYQFGHQTPILLFFDARLLNNGRYHGNRIMAATSGRCEHPSLVQIAPLVDEHFKHFSIRRPSSILIEILSFWTTHEVDCAVWLSCENLVSIRY